MKTNLFIPKKLKVGFQKRQDTFTGKLSYITYYDEKEKLRKEASWTSWCDNTIPSIEVDNTPRAGYIFNKGIRRDNYSGWGGGRSVIRVHDPRDFEFEISVDNLIGILTHSDISKRDIQEECVFAWSGTELVLLPVNSVAYQEATAFTEKQDKKISAKELVKGATYSQKKSEDLFIYMGRMDWFDFHYKEKDTDTFKKRPSWHGQTFYTGQYHHQSTGKEHIFYNTTSKAFELISVSTLSSCVNESVSPDFSNLLEKWFLTHNSQPLIGVKLVPFTPLKPKNGNFHFAYNLTLFSQKSGDESHGQLDMYRPYSYESSSYTLKKNGAFNYLKKDNDVFFVDAKAPEYEYNYHSTRKENPNQEELFELHFVLKNGNSSAFYKIESE